MVSKAPTGIRPFDDACGGFYAGRVTLLTGKSGSGKTVFGLQFLREGLLHEERGLILSTSPVQDVAIQAAGIGVPVDQAVEAGNLLMLEYSDELSTGRSENIMLPPEGFLQFSSIIESHAVQRVVLDTVVPWVTLPSAEHLEEHVFSLVRAFDRLGVTTLFTMPRPASGGAQRLRKLLQGVVPISIMLTADDDRDDIRRLEVSKYLGATDKAAPIPVELQSGAGLVRPGSPPAGNDRKPADGRPPPKSGGGSRSAASDESPPRCRPSFVRRSPSVAAGEAGAGAPAAAEKVTDGEKRSAKKGLDFSNVMDGDSMILRQQQE